MTYQPLPEELYIRRSTIEGMGLFAKQDIEGNINLGMTHIIVKGEIIRTPLGGFINHSETPNLQVVIQTNGNYHIKTLFDIRAGDELTLKYNLYTPKT